MESSSLSNIVTALAWPIIVLAALIIFRKPLSEVLLKVLKIKIKAGKFEFESIKETVQGYFSPQVIDYIKKHPDQVMFLPHRAHITLLALDIKGFTDKAELDPCRLSILLHDFLTKMTDIIFELGGTLNSMEGFFLLSSWGAPIAWPNSADRACQAALQMVAAIQQLNDELKAKALSPLRLRIGINTGDVLTGNLGIDRRFAYSVMGDSVDLAVRLSNLVQQYPADILISQFTFEELKDHFDTQSMGELKVPGLDAPIPIYSLITDTGNGKTE